MNTQVALCIIYVLVINRIVPITNKLNQRLNFKSLTEAFVQQYDEKAVVWVKCTLQTNPKQFENHHNFNT